MRASPCDLPFVVVNQYHQPAYRAYLSLLPQYLQATFKGVRVAANQPFHPIMHKTPLMPLRYPKIAISYPGSIPNVIKPIIENLGYHDLKVKGQNVISIEYPGVDAFTTIYNNTSNKTTAAPIDHVNLSCYPFIALVNRVLSAFFRMHQYPAFKDKGHLQDVENMNLEAGTGKRKLVSDEVAVEEGPPRKKGPLAGSSARIEGDVMDEDVPEEDRIKVALPQTPGEGWIEADTTLSMPGLFFQYVEDLANTDKRTMMEICTTYFLGCFGSNRNEIHAMVERLRGAWGMISETRLGRELTHMAKCIHIGLRAQARIVPVFSEGDYCGCLILGEGFSVSLWGKLYEPLDALLLAKDLDSFGRKGYILNMISTELGLTEDERGVLSECNTFFQLRKLMRAAHTNDEQKRRISMLVPKLRYGKHWALNETTIAHALDLIKSGSFDNLSDVPCHPSTIFSDDLIEVVLSGFGLMAPTCNFLGGPVVDLSKGKIPDGPMAWSMRPLAQAVADLKAIMSNKAYCRAQGGRRSGPFKDRMFEKGAKASVFSSLKACVGVSSTGGSGEVSGASTGFAAGSGLLELTF